MDVTKFMETNTVYRSTLPRLKALFTIQIYVKQINPKLLFLVIFLVSCFRELSRIIIIGFRAISCKMLGENAV